MLTGTVDPAAVIAFIESSKYTLLWLACYFEGTVAMLTGGILVRLHETPFLVVYPLLVSADFISDITWYVLGYYGGRPFALRWGYLVGFSKGIIEKVERRFHKYHTSILVMSKLTMGFGLATGVLFTAGMMRISFARFLVINFIGSLVWVLCMMLVGYYFGDVLAMIPTKYQVAGAAIVIVAAFAFLRWLTNRLAEVEW